MMNIMFPRKLHLPLACLLALCLLTNPVSAYGYVWCLGADGHAEMETAMAGDCAVACDVAFSAKAPLVSVDADADGCGPCLDISTSHQYHTPNNRGDETLILSLAEAAPVIVTVHLPLPERSLNSHHFTDPPPRIPDLILHHRTTVLLI